MIFSELCDQKPWQKIRVNGCDFCMMILLKPFSWAVSMLLRERVTKI